MKIIVPDFFFFLSTVAWEIGLCVIIKADKIGLMNQQRQLENSTFWGFFFSLSIETFCWDWRASAFLIPNVIWAVWEANNRRDPEDGSIVGKH